MTPTFGRDEENWAVLVDETVRFLADQGSLRRLTTYTELNAVLTQRTGVRPFDFGSERDRAAMGEVLGQATQREYSRVGAMISAIVIYLNENDAGPGFYRLAQQMGLMGSKPPATVRDAFWAGQVAAVHDFYGGKK